MSTKKTIALTVLATLAIGATTAFAFGPSHQRHGMGFGPGNHMGFGKGKEIFKKLDTNKDGVITRQEAEAVRAERFKKADADNNGTVTAAEIDKVVENRLQRMKVRLRYKMLSRLDKNGDGEISQQEFSKKSMRLFDMADTNGDDKVTRQEAQQLRQRGRGFMRRMFRGGNSGNQGGHRRQWGQSGHNDQGGHGGQWGRNNHNGQGGYGGQGRKWGQNNHNGQGGQGRQWGQYKFGADKPTPNAN